ncbi:hypothetical protein TRVA0_007S01508 [Trichomonascus vanleenenianus]|uniref:uncharacterized protein n=1 Tax=Trichomonascus vanleenenianus TaxID=2268995 RepID=UPI003ECABFA1
MGTSDLGDAVDCGAGKRHILQTCRFLPPDSTMSDEQQRSHGTPRETENKPNDPLTGAKLGLAGARIPQRPHNYRPPGTERIVKVSDVKSDQAASQEQDKKKD